MRVQTRNYFYNEMYFVTQFFESNMIGYKDQIDRLRQRLSFLVCIKPFFFFLRVTPKMSSPIIDILQLLASFIRLRC